MAYFIVGVISLSIGAIGGFLVGGANRKSAESASAFYKAKVADLEAWIMAHRGGSK